MGTGTAVATGDIITAAKQNLKMEDARDLSALGLLELSGTGTKELLFAVTENLTDDRTLTLIVNDTDRTINLSGNLVLAGTLTTTGAITFAGAFTLGITLTGDTTLTFPESGTLVTLNGTEELDNKTLDTSVAKGTWTASGTWTIPAVTLGGTLTWNSKACSGTCTDLGTITTADINGGTIDGLTSLGIRSTGAAFDLKFATAVVFTATRTLTITIPDAACALTLTGDLIRVGAHSLTLTTGGVTNVTLPTSGTLAVTGANTFTGDQTLDGNVDTILHVTTSPIIDVGADIFPTGTFIDIAFDTGVTLTGALIGMNIDLSTNVTISNQSVTGIDVTLPGTFGNGTEYGIRIRGDGQTILIGNDTDLYISLAKASSVDIDIQGISPVFNIGADVLESGYIFSVDYDTAETTSGDLYILDVFRAANALTLGADLYGINLNFNSNVVAAADRDVIGYRLTTPALTSAGANATVFTGFTIPTAGALVMNNAGGSITFYGINIQMPNITQTAGTMTAIGIQLTEGTTTSGTINAININGNVDTIINFSASPIVDIGADVFSTGYFMDLSFDTIETLTAQLTGIRIDWDTVVVTTGGAGTGNITPFWADLGNLSVNAAYNATIYGIRLDLDFTVGGAETIYGVSVVMPATYGTGTEVGVRVTGDGQTILIGNDADLYVSLAKANSVDILIQGVTPVLDIGADVFNTGTIIDFQFDTAETAAGALIGVSINMNTNLTPLGGQNITGITTQTAVFTNAAAAATVLTGYQLPTAGALDNQNAGGSITWYGLDLQMPNITQTGGAMVAIGIRLTEGVTTSGTINAININGTGVDTIINFTASPILDIGADVFSTGYFMDLGFDTIETLTAQLTGIRIDWDTVVVTTGGAGTGNITAFWADLGQLAVAGAYNGTIYGIRLDLDFVVGGAETIRGASIVMPAAFGAGTETGIYVTGDGQTISICNDTDLYISLAKANSVDINIQGISPILDIGADVLVAGYFLSIDYDTIETTTGDLYIIDVFRAAFALTLGADLYGINLNFNTNVTAAADMDVIGYRLTTPALTSAGANNTYFYGFTLPTAGALVMNNAGGSLNFYGLNIQMPAITQTAGTMLAVGIQLTEGVTTSGTCNAININGDVDTIVNFSASPIIDIGADVFNTGTIFDFQFDTAETAVGALIGVSINMNTNLTPLGGQNITGYTTQTAAFTSVAAAATVITGYQLPTAGALVMNNAGGSITWYGVDLQMPNVTQTAGTMTASAIRITEGVTTSGTATGIVINVTRAISFPKASDLIIVANTATSLEISDGTTSYLAIDTRTAITGVTAFAFDASDPTIVSANGTTWNLMTLNAMTVNLTGGIQVTAMNGISLYITQPIIAANQATTVVTASTLYLTPPGLGANIAITNNYIVNTSVAGCFCTAGGVWTSVSGRQYKTAIKKLNLDRMPQLIKELPVKTYQRKDPTDGGFERFGVIAEEAPDYLVDPTRKGMAAIHMAGFSLAAIKYLQDAVEKSNQRIEQLEAQLAS